MHRAEHVMGNFQNPWKDKENMKQNGHIFTHAKGLSIETLPDFQPFHSAYSAPQWEPKMWKGPYSDPSPIPENFGFSGQVFDQGYNF